MITLNFPENVELRILVDYVSRRLGMNILYDEQILRRRVTVRSPAAIPETSLLGLLHSVLRLNDLAIVPAAEAGWWRIVQAQDLTVIANLDRGAAAAGMATTAVTTILQPRHVDIAQLEQVVRPFLTPRGAGTIQIADQNLLIVTDYATNIERIVDLMDVVDRPGLKRTIHFQSLEHLEAAPLATHLGQLMSAVHSDARGRRGLEIRPETRTNRLVLIGPADRVKEAVDMIQMLDIPLNVETRLYPLRFVSPERIDRILRDLVGRSASDQQYRSSIDRDANLLLLTTTPVIHDQARGLIDRLDIAPTAEQSPIRFYKIRNSSATELLATIRTIESEGSIDTLLFEGGGSPPNPSGSAAPAPGVGPLSGVPDGNTTAGSLSDGVVAEGLTAREHANAASPEAANAVSPAAAAGHQGQGRVTADQATNSLIVVGDPATQQFYARLIELLDRRRPQVLIEVTLISLDTSRGHSVGVEIGRTTDIGSDGRVLTFSSFGLSDVNATTGQLSIKPGLGFNGAILSPDIADIVIRAVATDTKAQVVSAPKILVNDNATGVLTSINEAPFTSINASQTVATTSFAGFASAGTTISVTPQINEGDHLQLRYSVNLSSFTGEGGEGLPPPRQTNTVSSQITVPDGHTIVIGGLNRRDSSQTTTKIPLLGELPLVQHLFQSRTVNQSESTLFVFVRPIILRDDQFRDLRFFSRDDQRRAGLESDDPSSLPMLLE